jgi:hypothetical protein
MQAQTDYITVDNTMSASMKGGIKINKGIFIGTKRYLFFVPEEIQEHSSTEVTTTTFTTGGKLASEILIDKVNEEGLKVRDFEKYMLEEVAPHYDIEICELDIDIEQLKITSNFFGGSILINKSIGKVGWTAFILKTGKKKKLVRQFYLSHPKLINK